jgi:CheY-like chemotaxis protein
MLVNILVVEDDPLVAMMLEDYLELLGRNTVAVVENVAGALAAIADRPIDAAILDVHLSGGETSEPIAAALSTKNIPFLVCTGGFTAPAAAIYASRPLLIKPFNFERIDEGLRALEN